MLRLGVPVIGVTDEWRSATWEADWDRYPPDPDFVVLADPDGNAFCVVDSGGALPTS
ncbi:hypothetical protein ACFVHR_20985 [Streptomyces sp. NPDC127168]|uniref:hypothetical protein n=1 Tax=unclassified Streptomyces TaxID=2593676 RepID=UPI00363B39AD